MKTINNIGKEKTEVYSYEVTNHHSIDDVTKGNETVIKIVFTNNHFTKVKYQFNAPYIRGEWIILKEIAEEIERIETMYNTKAE